METPASHPRQRRSVIHMTVPVRLVAVAARSLVGFLCEGVCFSSLVLPEGVFRVVCEVADTETSLQLTQVLPQLQVLCVCVCTCVCTYVYVCGGRGGTNWDNTTVIYYLLYYLLYLIKNPPKTEILTHTYVVRQKIEKLCVCVHVCVCVRVCARVCVCTCVVCVHTLNQMWFMACVVLNLFLLLT